MKWLRGEKLLAVASDHAPPGSAWSALWTFPTMIGAAFVVAVFSWGINFYGPSVYLHALHAREGWPPSLVSAAVTLHFLASGAIVTRLYDMGPAADICVGCHMATGIDADHSGHDYVYTQVK